MQLQNDVGAFCCVVCSGCQIHLIEANLFGTLAHDFGIADGLHTEMSQRKAVQVVRLMAFQHVRLQQCVLGDARKLNSMVSKDVLIVFEILSQFFVLCAFQPRLEF